MSSQSLPAPVMQLRLVVEAEDFGEALAFYRDALRLTEQTAFEGDSDARVVILDAGRATLDAAPVETPWRSLNSRLGAPAGLQITLFEELESRNVGEEP